MTQPELEGEPATGPGHYVERAAELVDQIELRDGSTAWVGPLLSGDREDLAREYETLSPTSRRRRFLASVNCLGPALLDVLVDGVDGVEHVALVVFVEVENDPTPVAVGRIIRHKTLPDTADVGVTVKDAWQGRGIGSELIKLLVARRPTGVTHLLTEVSDDNPASLALLRSVGRASVHPVGAGVLDVEVDLSGGSSRHTTPVDGARLHPVLATPGHDHLRRRDRDVGL